MSLVRRALIVAAIAAVAVVPLRAFGVVGGGSGGLAVSASLAGCGVGGNGIVCQIEVSFTGVDDADYYTASVTRADGSVQDLGTVGSGEGGGSATVSVPYVGAGSYTVTVSAWGTEDDDEKAKLLEREKADAGDRKADGAVEAEPVAEDEAPAEPAPADSGETEEPPPPEPAEPPEPPPAAPEPPPPPGEPVAPAEPESPAGTPPA